MRTRNALINSLVGFAAQLLIAILSFINRSVFISALGGEYLGVTGLFTNILTMLSLSEMGVGTAITFYLYKAVADENQERINALMSFYARFFRWIAVCVFGLGLVCMGFLPYLIKETTMDMNFLRVVLMLYILESCVGYLLGYRSTLLFVNQKEYVNRLIISVCTILATAAQIFTLKIASRHMSPQNAYLVYLCVYMLGAILKNLAVYLASRKFFPQVKVSGRYKLPADILSGIKKRVKAMVVHKASSVVTNATDNLIISKYVGLLAVGQYSNYATVITMATTLFEQLMAGIQAGVGNLLASDDRGKIEEVFDRLYFISFQIVSLVFTCMVALFNPFIMLWIKDAAYQMDMSIVLVVCVNFYIIGLRQPVLITRNAGGLFVHDWMAPLIKAIVNLVVSIVLAIKMGLIGVFIGTLVSSLISDVGITPTIFYRKLFNKKPMKYYLRYLAYAVLTAANTLLALKIPDVIPYFAQSGVWPFLLRGAVTAALVLLTVLVFFGRTEEYRFFISLAKRMMNKILQKGEGENA